MIIMVVVVVVVTAQSREIKVEKTIGSRRGRRFAQRRRRCGYAIAERQRIFARVIGYSIPIRCSIAIIAFMVIIVITPVIIIIIAVAVAVAAVVFAIRGDGTVFVRRPHSFANSKRLIEYGETPRSKAERERAHSHSHTHTAVCIGHKQQQRSNKIKSLRWRKLRRSCALSLTLSYWCSLSVCLPAAAAGQQRNPLELLRLHAGAQCDRSYLYSAFRLAAFSQKVLG